ncbi:MAG TPA: hypothetical protein VG944_05205 [Fimbriimonas sp.]|nr:hypothetical protein [Fimbriimonas sp.]
MARWIGIAVLAAVAYGISNDQITVTLSPEYFSVFKARQFAPFLRTAGLADAPIRVQAVAVGVLATWWFGLLLGVLLSLAGALGSRNPISNRTYCLSVLSTMLFALVLSAVFGAIGYSVEPVLQPTGSKWPFLDGIHDVRRAFAVGFWHTGAYLGGFVGVIAAAVWIVWSRVRR